MPKFELKLGKEVYAGKNRKEATETALAHLEALISNQDWKPEVFPIHLGGKTFCATVFANKAGFWSYVLTDSDGSGIEHAGGWDRRTAIFRARRHLAQLAYRPGVTGTLGLIHWEDIEGQEEHSRWLRFQALYEQAIASGKSKDDAWHYAAGLA